MKIDTLNDTLHRYFSHRICLKAYSIQKLAVYGNLVFYIFAHDLLERMHIHVSNTKSRSGQSAKIWLDTLDISERGSLTKKEISTALKLLAKHNESIMRSINSFATDGEMKTLYLQ